jgi:hypothetical protein
MASYDDPSSDFWRGEHLPVGAPHERVTHPVFVDGRVVDQWSGAARGTRWRPCADRFDGARRPSPSPPIHYRLGVRAPHGFYRAR